MNKKLRSLILAIFMALAASFTLDSARPPALDYHNLLASLPTSDVVIFVDLQRIMTEIVPRLLAKDPATLLKVTSAINEVKTKSGVNLLAIDSIVCGVQFGKDIKHSMKKEDLGIAILAHGDFDANALIAFVKQETKGKFHEETYGGKVIYSEPKPAPPRKKTDRETAALTVLDANTVALGDLPQIRAAIDAFAGKGRVDPALIQLAERESSSIIGMAGNVPAALVQDLKETAPPKDETAQAINKTIEGIKQIFGSIGATPADFNVITGARLSSAEQAASISDMLLGLRQQAISEVQDPQTRGLLESLQITAQGEEIQLRADIKNEIVQEFVASMMKEEKPTVIPVVKPAAAKTKQTTKARRGKRRKRH